MKSPRLSAAITGACLALSAAGSPAVRASGAKPS